MSEIHASRVGPGELVYIEKVRQAMRRLTSQDPEPEDVAQAVQAVRDRSSFDVEVPTASRRREFEMVKTGIKRLSVWYMRYLAGQLNAFANSVTQLGEALAARTQQLEGVTDDVLARLSAAEERLARLEQAPPPEATVTRLPGGGPVGLSRPETGKPVPVSPAAQPVQAQAVGTSGRPAQEGLGRPGSATRAGKKSTGTSPARPARAGAGASGKPANGTASAGAGGGPSSSKAAGGTGPARPGANRRKGRNQ
jgi:hypothetical protein